MKSLINFLLLSTTSSRSIFRMNLLYKSIHSNSVKVSETSSSNYRCNIAFSEKEKLSTLYKCDNPTQSEMYPSPKEYLLASLASCTAMTIRTFHENSKKASASWGKSTLNYIEVSAREVMGSDEHVPVGLKVDVHIKGSFTEEQLQRLKEVTDSCPVKRSVTSTRIINSCRYFILT